MLPRHVRENTSGFQVHSPHQYHNGQHDGVCSNPQCGVGAGVGQDKVKPGLVARVFNFSIVTASSEVAEIVKAMYTADDHAEVQDFHLLGVTHMLADNRDDSNIQ